MAPAQAHPHGIDRVPDLEATMPVALEDEKRAADLFIEDKPDFNDLAYNPNSPEAILDRYPLLKNKSESELDILNRQLRRRM
jgi:hypothetical protein